MRVLACAPTCPQVRIVAMPNTWFGKHRHARYHLGVPLRAVRHARLNEKGELLEL